MTRTELLIIDPQNDFCDRRGSLYVGDPNTPNTGAEKDGAILADFIKRNIYVIFDIHCTQDSHRTMDVAHPIFWKNKFGQNPPPFTLISDDDVKKSIWGPFNSNIKCPPYGTLLDRMVHYTETLKKNGKYVLCIWPPHCRIGTWGHNIYLPVMEAFDEWEAKRFGIVDYVTKGSNLFTEHYSALEADVPDPEDPTTLLNINLIQTLERADVLLVSGQAKSHCVAYTLRGLVKNFGKDSVKKIILLIDTMSSVPGFEKLGDDFIDEMVSIGVQIREAATFNL